MPTNKKIVIKVKGKFSPEHDRKIATLADQIVEAVAEEGRLRDDIYGQRLLLDRVYQIIERAVRR